MTTVTPATIAHQLAALAAQLEEQVAPKPELDAKYIVTAEFAEVPKDKVAPLLKEWRAAKKKLDERKSALEDIERKLKDLMDGAEVLVIEETGQHVVESRVTVGQVFDTTRFKKENPQEAAKWLRDRYSRNFRILV